MTQHDDMRREIVLRELNQGALAGMQSEVTEQAATLVLAALDRYDNWAAGKHEARLARIAEAHSKDTADGGLTSGCCSECRQPWGASGCPTYVWATTERDPLATWDPADDEAQPAQPEADITERLERGREQLIEAMSGVSEERWYAGWMHDLDRRLHAEGGIWEILGRAVGWPTGDYNQWVWVSWDEAAALYAQSQTGGGE